jgi:hypothetical protein
MTPINCLREAPLVSLNVDLYSFTLNVSPKKYINGKPWSTYTQADQKIIFGQYFESLAEMDELIYEFEPTLAGYIHVHGMFKADKEDAQLFQEKACKRFGMPKLAWDVCCRIEPIYDRQGWLRYMRKTRIPESPTDYIPDRSLFY